MAKKQTSTTALVITAIIAFAVGYLFAQQTVQPTQTTTDETGAITEEDGTMTGDTTSEDGTMMEDDQSMNSDEERPLGFALTGYALEEGGVHLEWKVPDNRREPDRFMVVRSEEPNPVHDGTNYWYRQDGSVREVDWKDVPDGTHNFRVCILEDDECVEYTNNLELTAQDIEG